MKAGLDISGILRIAGLALVLAVVPGAAGAETYLILPDGSGDFPTIQAAVGAAATGDVILLGNGTFRGAGNRDVDFQGKALTVRSQSGHADACRIDCEGSPQEPHRAFRYASGEGEDAALEAVTIANGYAPGGVPLGQGGGLLIAADAMPSIVGCVFEANHSEFGGGVYCTHANPVFVDCIFRGNYAEHEGAGLCFADNSFPVIRACTFIENLAIDDGGAITSEWSAVTVTGCTFVRNRAWMGSSIAAWLGSLIVADATIMAFSTRGRPVSCEDATIWISCCDVYGNDEGDWIGCLEGFDGADGNIGADPLFCDLEGEDLRLEDGSPCVPGGECDRMGAWPVGCGSTPATVVSWGALKALFAR
jgi:hypothetical protein